jgi:hypothetical protein
MNGENGMTRIPAVLALTVALGACTAAQIGTAQTVAAQATPAVGTLAALAAAHSTTVASLITKGALFCQKADGTVAAVASVTGIAAPVAAVIPGAAVAVSVIGASAAAVAGVCAAIQAVPVPAPTNVAPDGVAVVVVPAASALKPAS